MRLHRLAVLFLFALGCGGSQEEPATLPPQEPPPPRREASAPPPPPAPVELSVRVIHAAAHAKAAPVTVRHQGHGSSGPLANDVAFGAAGAYASASLAPDAQSISLSVAAEGVEPLEDSRRISPGDPHTAIVFTTANEPQGFDVLVAHDSPRAPSSGTTKVRFFHGVHGWAQVDVCGPGATARDPGTPLFPAATYGQMSNPEYIDLPASVQTLQFRQVRPDAPCTGRVVGVADIAPTEGATLDAQNVTIVAIGRGVGRPFVPRAMLTCLDAPAAQPTCASQPMRGR